MFTEMKTIKQRKTTSYKENRKDSNKMNLLKQQTEQKSIKSSSKVDDDIFNYQQKGIFYQYINLSFVLLSFL